MSSSTAVASSVVSGITGAASRTLITMSSHSPSSTTSSAASASSSAAAGGGGGGGGGGGPTSSPLLFFVALGFGVVFTNLWIIVGVKYCFRYNQRNRAMREAADGGPIDLANMPRPHRRRREKKLMSMEEVNDRFPRTKYKTWRATREHQGLPAAGGITAPPSRSASLRRADATAEARRSVEAEPRRSADTPRPSTAKPDHHNRLSGVGDRPATAVGLVSTPEVVEVTSPSKPQPTAAEVGKSDTEEGRTVISIDHPTVAAKDTVDNDDDDDDDDDDDGDDPIQAADAVVLAQPPGDTCAICLDTLDEEEDVRGLSCGHAFHAACVDPWLTSRRACCPLCKADYYVPKPRPDGEQEPTSTAGRRSATTGPGWLGSRYMMLRPRGLFRTSRAGFAGRMDRRGPTGGGGRRPSQAAAPSLSNINSRATSTAQQPGRPSWRARLPILGDRQRQTWAPNTPYPARGAPENGRPASPRTPAQLEAGTAGHS